MILYKIIDILKLIIFITISFFIKIKYAFNQTKSLIKINIEKRLPRPKDRKIYNFEDLILLQKIENLLISK